MSVITFVNNRTEETGKTLSLVAIATYMAIEKNNKILIISTTDRENRMKHCFFDESQAKKNRLAIFGHNNSAIDTESGIDGISKMIRSKRLKPDIVTNYTKVVFKDRLEILLGREQPPIDKKQSDKTQINIMIKFLLILIIILMKKYVKK